MKWLGYTDRVLEHKHEDGTLSYTLLCFTKPHEDVIKINPGLADYPLCHIELHPTEVPSQIWNKAKNQIENRIDRTWFIWTIDGAYERWEWNKQ